MCPPSNAGIGSRFNTPKFTEIKAVKEKAIALLGWALDGAREDNKANPGTTPKKNLP